MASKLAVFNDTLAHLGESRIVSLEERREPRRVLDNAWNERVRYCLERAFWNFAMRSVEISASDSVEPQFGMSNAFEKPDDWLRTYQAADNERFDPQLLDFNDEGSNFFADIDPLFLRYTSSDTSFGFDLGKWPQSFADYVAGHMAARFCFKITGSDDRLDRLQKLEKRLFAIAASTDAMNEPPARRPFNSWAMSRGAGNFNRDRWNRRS